MRVFAPGRARRLPSLCVLLTRRTKTLARARPYSGPGAADPSPASTICVAVYIVTRVQSPACPRHRLSRIVRAFYFPSSPPAHPYLYGCSGRPSRAVFELFRSLHRTDDLHEYKFSTVQGYRCAVSCLIFFYHFHFYWGSQSPINPPDFHLRKLEPNKWDSGSESCIVSDNIMLRAIG